MQYIPCTNNRIGHNSTRNNRYTTKKDIYNTENIYTLGAETFARRKIRDIFAFREHILSRIGQNRIFRVLNFREWTEKLNFVVLRKCLDPDRNKREKKILLFQVFVAIGLFFVHQTFF